MVVSRCAPGESSGQGGRGGTTGHIRKKGNWTKVTCAVMCGSARRSRTWRTVGSSTAAASCPVASGSMRMGIGRGTEDHAASSAWASDPACSRSKQCTLWREARPTGWPRWPTSRRSSTRAAWVPGDEACRQRDAQGSRSRQVAIGPLHAIGASGSVLGMSADREEPAFLRMRWKTVAVGSLLVNMAAVAGISTLAVAQNANALATVALALAVIAFVCQLIVFAIQTAQSGQQLRQAQELNAATEALLAEARTRLEGTHQMVSSQYQELMHLAALKGRSDSVSAPNGSIDTGAVAALEAQRVGGSVRVGESAVSEWSSERRAPVLEWDLTLDEAREHLETLSRIGSLFIFGVDLAAYIKGKRQGVEMDLQYSASDKSLIDLGLVAEGPLRDSGERTVVVTELGARVGQLLAAPWPPPKELDPVKDDIWALRSKLPDNIRGWLV